MMGDPIVGTNGYRGTRVRPRRTRWIAAATLLVAVGSASSVFGAAVVAHSASQQSHQAFVSSSTEVASTLQLALQREEDLVVNAGAFLAANPDATQAQFQQWTSSVRAFVRYPELQAIAELVLVPASQLSAFVAHFEPAGGGGAFQIIPAGNRPYYCLTTVGQSRSAQVAAPAGVDYCAVNTGAEFLESRDSGQVSYVPFVAGKSVELGVGTPIYRGGVVPSTIAARREAFIGWIGTQIVPSVILTTARHADPDAAATLSYRRGATKASFGIGVKRAGAQSFSISLHNGWVVQTFAVVGGGGVLGNGAAVALLVAGVLLSLLLAALIFVLGTGRSRAVELVHERTDQLRHQAFHDSLTGLPNRALILDRIDQMLARSRRERSPVAALFLDLDDFKDINDTLGHGAGDQVLVAVGTRLASTLREGDTVGRLGGDEFVVLVDGASLAAGAGVVAQRILDVLETPFELPGSDIALTVAVSIGIAEGDRISAELLLRDADIALYRAKAAGKHCAVTFSPSMQVDAEDHRSLEADLRLALEDHQFFLLYQPTFDLSTGAMVGVEALLRWRHPERGVVLPDVFIPVLESSGMIISVGHWVLQEACQQGARWHRQGHRFAISINVSGRQLERDRIIDDVYGALSASALDPGMLILELTETSLMQNVESTVARLQLLKAVGVRLAVDDFGTGYSSISYLQQFPVDILKIDRSFVSRIADSNESAALVHTLVQLGKVLGLATVAEGIETDEQRDKLRAEKVDIGQGYLFARPLSVVAIERLLSDASATGEVPVTSR
jgi:diguanylate cyclase (GGDEF)-like protein